MSKGNNFLSGQTLMPGQSLQSPNGLYQLALQKDGDLVLKNGNKSIWVSNTAGKAVSKCIMKDEGNLVIDYSLDGSTWVQWRVFS